MKSGNAIYKVHTNYKTQDEQERRYVVSKKLADIINLTVNARKI